MKKALLALNSIRKSGVIDDYAIGGAIAASFYIEAVNTEDIDGRAQKPTATPWRG